MSSLDWDLRSSVRSKPRRLLEEREEGKAFFSATLTSIATHPLVEARGPALRDELLVRRLGNYMDFTIGVEQDIVNPVLLKLGRGIVADLPAEMRFEANRIYCDEAYHAVSAFDMRWQVERYTGVAMSPAYELGFAHALRDAKQRVPSPLHDLVDLCATIVSETLISGILSKVPADPTVVSGVRESIADHAADERTHHAYFTRVFETVWPTINNDSRDLVAPLFADLIIGFLTPDVAAEMVILRAAGFTGEDARQIVTESHSPGRVAEMIRHEARATLKLMERLGLLDSDRTRSRFEALSLRVPNGR